ncbi:MAG: type transport system permease protein [Solirubrobacteraceae bacterium]|nr:type transport system permease protein [Solirubrobacteraceae bacterium]
MSAGAATLPRARGRTRRPGTLTVYRWEIRKLIAQKRTYLGLGAAVIVPLIFIVALAVNPNGGPEDVPFGRYVRETGLAIPLVGLIFGAIWLFPLITALVAGDIVATEDNHGTLKTILTRSVERWQVFLGKLLASMTYATLALVAFVLTGLIVGGLAYGFNPVTLLTGTKVSVGRGLVLLAAASGAYLVPVAAITAIALLLSTVTRNSAAAVVGTLMTSLMMQILGALAALNFLDPYLLSTQFNAWQGLLRDPADWDPVIRAVWVSACYGIPAIGVSFLTFLRRDVTGG